MTFSTGQIESLQAPLNRSAVKSRDQAGRKLSYIEGWHAIDEANRIFGHDAWDRETFYQQETSRDLVELTNQKGSYKQWRVSYIAKVRITVYAGNDRVIKREGTGYGSGMAKPEALGDAVESAIKEAETDAMKRALMTFGNPFGLALYDKDQTNVVNDPPAETAPTTNVTKISERARATAPRSETRAAAPAAQTVLSDAVLNYIDAFETKLQFCDALSDIDTAWIEEKANRAGLGIIKDSPAYKQLAALGSKRRAEIEEEVTRVMRG